MECGPTSSDYVTVRVSNFIKDRYDSFRFGSNRPRIRLGIVTIVCHRDELIRGFVFQVLNETDPFAHIVGRFGLRVDDSVDLQLDLR
ncbi:hypothetical protein D3C76_958600 [compost metagenome]